MRNTWSSVLRMAVLMPSDSARCSVSQTFSSVKYCVMRVET